MNLNSILFPAPSCSYDYNKLKGQLIFIPKWKKVPVILRKNLKANTDNLHTKNLQREQKSNSSKIFNSLVVNPDYSKEFNVPIVNPTLLSPRILATNDKIPLPERRINHVKTNDTFKAPRSYASNSMNKMKNLILNNKLDLSTTDSSRINRISSSELNNEYITGRTLDISNDCNKEKISNCDESYVVEDQEMEYKNVTLNKDFKFIRSSSTKSLLNLRNQLSKPAEVLTNIFKPHKKSSIKCLDELKLPMEKNTSSTNFDTCIFDENPVHPNKNNVPNDLSRACSPNNVSKYNTTNSKLLNQHLRNPFSSSFLPINLKAEDHNNMYPLGNYRINSNSMNLTNGMTIRDNNLDNNNANSGIFGANMSIGISNNETSSMSTAQLMTSFTNIIDHYIPCLYLETTKSSNKILIYFHGNGEDVNLALDLIKHIQNTMNVFFFL